MSGAQDKRMKFAHAQKRLQERYGIELTRDEWNEWNRTFRDAPLIEEQPYDRTVRLLRFKGKTIRVVCGKKIVLTVLPP